MSLKSTFLAFKKSCTSCPNWGEGVGIIWTKSKRTAAFFRETFPKLTNFQRTEKYSIAMFSLLDILLLMQGMLGEREDWEDNLMRAEEG